MQNIQIAYLFVTWLGFFGLGVVVGRIVEKSELPCFLWFHHWVDYSETSTSECYGYTSQCTKCRKMVTRWGMKGA